MRRLLQLFLSMSKWERWTLSVLSVLAVLSLGMLVRRFYLQNTMLVPASGGSYIEGSVGELLPLNPWFIVQNDVNRDIVSLVFSGLLRYNPQTKAIEEDLATMDVSRDQKVYTLKLKDNLEWHDSTEQSPHPVTADDVVFTFKTIQEQAFPNILLQQNFRGVKIDKIDDRTVRFTLEEPYSFFPSNLTVGLLPKKSFEGIPVEKLSETLDFGFAPVGAGPYKVKSIVHTDLSTEVTLERFARSVGPVYRLDSIVFRIFPDYETLLSDMRNVDGVRLVPRNDRGDPLIPKRFSATQYTLPQYVALFFNLDNSKLQDQKLRQGLQQGTDKQAIADTLHESHIVDTPLLEIDTSDWHYKLDLDAAQGALLASKWNLPERYRLQKILEEEDANNAGFVHPPSVVLLEEGGGLTLTGSLLDLPPQPKVNGRVPGTSPTDSGSWIVRLPFREGTGSILPGRNLIKITGAKGKIVDSFYIFGAEDTAQERRAREERRLVHLYLQTRDGTLPPGTAPVTIASLALDGGFLRLRVPTDPPPIRVNEKGEPLKLTLLTSNQPHSYRLVAEEVQRQWRKLGVDVQIDVPDSMDAFQDRLLHRQYDILLFGQSLLDNLDSYPYWHSSGVQKITGDDKDLRSDAYNLSQYSSFEADNLLETIRRTGDENERQKSLKQLRGVLSNDVPAIFLYSPTYIFAHEREILGIELGSISLHSDRFLSMNKWYIKQERIFRPGISWWSFFGWLPKVFTGITQESSSEAVNPAVTASGSALSASSGNGNER